MAVDFTGSNGNPHQTNSLHYIDRSPYQRLNQYELAITSVGEIIQDYDRDQQYPALGFGAKIPPDNRESHCFPLTFQKDNPFCGGVSGLLEAYKAAVRKVELFAPTNFQPVIRHAMQLASRHQDGTNYFVLLIITDGAITDLEPTVEAIIDVNSSGCALKASVILRSSLLPCRHPAFQSLSSLSVWAPRISPLWRPSTRMDSDFRAVIAWLSATSSK